MSTNSENGGRVSQLETWCISTTTGGQGLVDQWSTTLRGNSRRRVSWARSSPWSVGFLPMWAYCLKWAYCLGGLFAFSGLFAFGGLFSFWACCLWWAICLWWAFCLRWVLCPFLIPFAFVLVQNIALLIYFKIKLSLLHKFQIINKQSQKSQ